jgi:hypothetical protein
MQNTTLASSPAHATSSPEKTTSRNAARLDRMFFGGMAIALTLTVFAGFSRTYYFNDFAAEPFELSPLLHWHGAAFTTWMLLLVAQTALIATRRVNVHRRLGAAGAVLAVLLVALGVTVAVTRTADGSIADHGDARARDGGRFSPAHRRHVGPDRIFWRGRLVRSRDGRLRPGDFEKRASRDALGRFVVRRVATAAAIDWRNAWVARIRRLAHRLIYPKR